MKGKIVVIMCESIARDNILSYQGTGTFNKKILSCKVLNVFVLSPINNQNTVRII